MILLIHKEEWLGLKGSIDYVLTFNMQDRIINGVRCHIIRF